MGLGIFVALLSALTVMPWTLIAPDLLLRVLLGLCFFGNLLPLLRSGDRWGMARLEYFLFNLIAVGPIATSLLLWINFLGHGEVITSVHAIRRVDHDTTMITYVFADDFLKDYPFARATYKDWFDIIGTHVRVATADGLFGVPVVVYKEPLVGPG